VKGHTEVFGEAVKGHRRDIGGADAIFILGMMPRSGTNFLWDLLCLHPDCAPARPPVMEDFFLEESDHLLDYTKAVRRWWDPDWGVFDEALMSELHRSIGDGLIAFLRADRDRRLVTKTPSVTHLDRFFTFFPAARLVILVRDGRSVVQSAMATFGWPFDQATRTWAQAADQIRRFEVEERDHQDRYFIARYEDLLDDAQAALVPVLRFLALDEDSFDFDAAARLPVRGSSFYFGRDHESVHWEPVERAPDFAPKERWRSWTPKMHERFEWLAGEQLRHFGYRGVVPPVDRPAAVIGHTIMDWGWHARSTVRRLAYGARVRLGTASRPLRQRLGLIRDAPSRR
jgi:protein-tyrosine sulfotransferase